ncbi:MAG: hypothetical protein Q7T18_10315 [Sedimentisphaerales bacterium]|nr:hypothetical protein [Sedimentisphaerales bacterium]
MINQFDPIGHADPLEVFRKPISAMSVEAGELLGLDLGANEWIFSYTDDGVTPLKIEWLDQDFAGAIKQQQIDLVIDSDSVEVASTASTELAGLSDSVYPSAPPYKFAVELHISLIDMLSSLAGGFGHDKGPAMDANHSERYDASLCVFFKVFNVGALGLRGPEKSAVLYVLEWTLEHLDLLKDQGVTALLIDGFQEADEVDVPIIVRRLEAIQDSGLSLCFLQSNPPQLLKISELNNIIEKESRISFIVRGLLREKNTVFLCPAEKSYPDSGHAGPRIQKKKSSLRKIGLPWQEVLAGGELVITEAEANKIRKIFNFKLAGLTGSQIAKTLSRTGVPKFPSLKPVVFESRINRWSRSVVFDVLNASLAFGNTRENDIHEKFKKISERFDPALPSAVLPAVVEEAVYCLVRHPLSVAYSDMDTLKTQSILTRVLSDRLFCGCNVHQKLLLKEKDGDSFAYFSPLRHRVCSCQSLVVNRDALEVCLQSVVLALVAVAPRVSDLTAIVKNELDALIVHSGQCLQRSKLDYEEKRKINVIDSSIGIVSRKINWLSNSEVESRLREFADLLSKEFLEKSEAMRFISLSQEVIASLFLDVHTGHIKIYWAHSLAYAERRLGKMVEQKSNSALLIPFGPVETCVLPSICVAG